MLWWLTQNALIAAVLAGLVFLVCRLGRFGPAVRHALWLVVLIKLLTPPLVAWPWPLPDLSTWTPTATATDHVPSAPNDLHVELEAILTPDQPASGQEVWNPSWDEMADEETAGNQHIAAWSWEVLAPWPLAFWLAGMAGMCILQVVRIVRFNRLTLRSKPAPCWLVEQVEQRARWLGVRRPLTFVLPGIDSPLVWSLGRPKLFWPASLVERLSAKRRRSVVAHELAHLRRRDHWVGWLLLIAECVWWWNPVFWYVRRQLRVNAELACDAWVIAMLPEDRRSYAEALIEVTELLSRPAAPVPALGMSSAARHDFERRLVMIMQDPAPCKVPVIGLVAIAMLAFVTLPGWSQVQYKILRTEELKSGEQEAPKTVILQTEDGSSSKPLIVHSDDRRIVFLASALASGRSQGPA